MEILILFLSQLSKTWRRTLMSFPFLTLLKSQITDKKRFQSWCFKISNWFVWVEKYVRRHFEAEKSSPDDPEKQKKIQFKNFFTQPSIWKSRMFIVYPEVSFIFHGFKISLRVRNLEKCLMRAFSMRMNSFFLLLIKAELLYFGRENRKKTKETKKMAKMFFVWLWALLLWKTLDAIIFVEEELGEKAASLIEALFWLFMTRLIWRSNQSTAAAAFADGES